MKKTNEPGIYRKTDGRLWVRATVQCKKTGAILQKTVTLERGATIQEAIATREELKAGLRQPQQKQQAESEAVPTTVADYAMDWLLRKAARSRKPSYLERCREALANHILPELGHLELATLTRQHVEAWVAWAERAHIEDEDGEPIEVYGIETVRGWWRVLKPMLMDAWAEGLLDTDVTRRVTAPEPTGAHRAKGKVREQSTLTEEQLAEFLRVVREDPRFASRHAEIATMALTGMRPGELYALRWDDVDLVNRSIRLDESAWRDFIGPTKTGDPRTAAMHFYLVPVLREHWRQQIVEQHRGLQLGLVFPSNAGTPRMAQSLTKVFRAASAECDFGIRIGCQVLRRTLNTLLREKAVHDNILQGQMGHCDLRMTRRYDSAPLAHKLDGVDRLQVGLTSD